MNILLIGNGFDLEHGLPTKYSDFLEFVESFYQVYKFLEEKQNFKSKVKDEYLKFILRNSETNVGEVLYEYLKFILENPETNVSDALYEYLENNIWILHFKNVYKKHLKNKENWIDFENEISEVVQNVDKLYHAYMEEMEENEAYKEKKICQCWEKLPSSFAKFKPNNYGIGNMFSVMLKDLNRLIGALEIYIYDYIDNWARIEYYNPDIEAIDPDAILSFNYSNTWQRIYAYNNKNVKISFIHGKAQSTPNTFCMDACIDKNQMVLGIDEYLSDDRKDKEVEFIAFKKYYQRIYKKTGNEYKSWLAEIDKQRKHGMNYENKLYIFGHSLDVTDGDILKELIEHEGIKTIIFHKDKAGLGQQIANLVKVLGSEKVIQYVYGSNPIIEFRQQKSREKIHGSTFEINSDIAKFDYFYKYKGGDLEKMILKFKRKIEECDLDYFCSQETVISFYDVLQKYGLGKKYERQLLDIADCLRNTTSTDKEPIQFQCDHWKHQNYDDSWKCDSLTKKFIETVNKQNKENFILSDSCHNDDSSDNILEVYQKIADNCKEIDEEKYIEILRDVLSKYKHSYGNIEEMLEFLVDLSARAANKISRETLVELLETEKSDWEICNYAYLLRRIERCNYFYKQINNGSVDNEEEF